MKLKNLLIATVAFTGLVACSSDNLKNESALGESTNVSVRVALPSLETRGSIEDKVTSDSPVLGTVSAYVMRGTTLVSKQNMTQDGAGYKTDFLNLSLNGTERVVVAANSLAGSDVITPQGYSVYDVQSDGTNNVGAIYYYDAKALKDSEKITHENKTIFTVDGMVLEPQASRVEVSGTVAFEEKLVESLTVTELTPNNYSEAFGASSRFLAVKTTTIPVTVEDALANLGKLSNVNFYDQIKDKSKVVANHLFNGDEKRVTFRMDAIVYDVLVNNKGERVKPVSNGNIEFDSYVYEDVSGALFVKVDNDYFALTPAANGDYVVLAAKYNKAATASTPGELKTYSTVVDKGAGYFNMVKFAQTINGNEINTSASEYYESGKIYGVFFDKIDWNGDGVIDGNDKYDPDENGDGSTDPSVFKADVIVSATVLNWTIENTGTVIE